MSHVISVSTDIATCLGLRRQVFIEEQGVSAADDVDGRDPDAVHLLASVNGQPVGTARLLNKAETGMIGRVCVLSSQRGKGLGAALIRAAVAEFRGWPGISKVKLGAQTHALGFYEKLGFVAFGPEYDDAGMPHRDMNLTL